MKRIKLFFPFIVICVVFLAYTAYASLLPDLSVTSSDIIFSNNAPEAGEVLSISATIRNNGAMYYNNTPFSKHDAQTGSSTNYVIVYSTFWLSQYFVPSSNTRLGKVSLLIRNAGDQTDSVTVEIRKKNSTILSASLQPGSLLASKTLVSTFTSFGWQDFEFDSQPMLSAGTTYWICLECLTPKPTAYYWWVDVGTTIDMLGGSITQGETWVSPAGVGGTYITYYRVFKCTDTVVSCHKGNPDTGGLLIGTTIYNTPIPSAGSRIALFNWPAVQGSNDIYWTVDRTDFIAETSESNNSAYKNISAIATLPQSLSSSSPPDLSITSSAIVFSKESPETGEVIAISATVHNSGGIYFDNTPFVKHDSASGIVSFAPIYNNKWYAQYFVPNTSQYLGKISLLMRNMGDISDQVTVKILKGKPYELKPSTATESLIVSKTLVSTFTSYGWTDFVFDTTPLLTAGATYWISAENSYPDNLSGYRWLVDTGTPINMLTTSSDQGQTWQTQAGNYNAYFKAYKTTDTIISCYRGNPASSGQLISKTIDPIPIPGGGTKQVSFNWTGVQGNADIYWTVDYANFIPETLENNNLAYKNINVISTLPQSLSSSSPPDLSITSSDIVFSKESPETGEVIAISATVHNSGGIYFDNTPFVKHDSASGITSFVPIYNDKWYSQYFVSSTNQYLGKVSLLMRNMGDISDQVTVKILKGKPYELKPSTSTESLIVSKTLVSTFTSYGWTDFVFETTPLLTAGATYWICAENSNPDSLSGYRWLVDTGTPANMLTTSSDQGQTWQTQAENYNAYFKAYKTTDTIISCYRGNPAGSGQLIGKNIISVPILTGTTKQVSFGWPAVQGSNDIYVAVDYSNIIQESQENNNTAFKNITSILTSPAITGTVSPLASSIGVSITEPVTITFNKAMDPVAAKSAISVKAVKDNKSTAITQNISSGTINYSNKVLTFNAAWNKGYTYQVTVSTAAKDIYGNTMQGFKTWSFSTIMDQAEQNIFIDDAQTKVVFEPDSLNSDYYIAIDTNPLSQESLYSKISAANDKIERIKGRFSSLITGSIRKLTAYTGSGTQFTGQFQKNITVTIPYTRTTNSLVKDSNGLFVKEKTLGLFLLDENNGLWVKIPNSKVDTTGHIVSAEVSHFSVYAIFGGSDSDLSGAYAYPVPWKPFSGNSSAGTLASGITFTGLGSRATIRIYTISAELVKVLEYQYSGGNEQIVWDGTNSDGQLAASGVYIYYIENEKEHKTGKLIIIK